MHQCAQCGASCQGLAVVPTAAERASIEALAEQLGVSRPFDGDRLRQNFGRCVFLEQSLCRLHATFGPASKPSACRQFPVVRSNLGDGIDPACFHPHQRNGESPEELHIELTSEPAAYALLRDAGWEQACEEPHWALFAESADLGPAVRNTLTEVARRAKRAPSPQQLQECRNALLRVALWGWLTPDQVPLALRMALVAAEFEAPSHQSVLASCARLLRAGLS